MGDNQDVKGASRRGFLKGAGTALGVVGVAGISSVVPGTGGEARAAAGHPANQWPWPYVKLDPTATAEIAYKEWYRVFCGGAVVSAVFGQLAEKVGEPYKSFPVDGFTFLEGGMSGWGTICGGNSGANIVTNLILGPRLAGSETGMLMGSEMMQWYSDAKMPVYTPKDPKVKTAIVQTESGSPLCHVSVGKWMKKSGYPLPSPERKDRCARLTASVAYHLVELLNDWKDGKYQTKGVIPWKQFHIPAQGNCAGCHGGGVPAPPLAAKT